MTNSTTEATMQPLFIDYLYGSICLACVLVGVPGNAFSFFSFAIQTRGPSSRIYACITVVDFMNCCNALAVGVTYLSGRQDIMFHDDVYCNIWGVTHRLLSALSIFCVAVLSISRTYVLIRPFKKLSTLVIELSLGLYFLAQACLATIPFWELKSKYVYRDVFATCETPSNIDQHRFEEFSDIASRISYFGPISPILISCGVSVGILLLRDKECIATKRMNSKRYASMTIVIFTLLFAAFNIPGTMISLLELNDEILRVDPQGHSLNFLYYLSIPINSALNPILYMFRMNYVRDMFVKIHLYLVKGDPSHLQHVLSQRSRSARSARSVMMNRSCTRMNIFAEGGGTESKESIKFTRATSCNLSHMMKNEYSLLRQDSSKL